MTLKYKSLLGDFMTRNIGVAEVKKCFSAVISEVSLKGGHFIIEKKGRPMAALVSVNDLQLIQSSKESGKRRGLLAAIGAWEDFEDLEGMVFSLYKRRKKAKDRGIGDLD
jgi:antitoxin (DNA-binding transcriptional repressor) of toxin-antitoxin stability system